MMRLLPFLIVLLLIACDAPKSKGKASEIGESTGLQKKNRQKKQQMQTQFKAFVESSVDTSDGLKIYAVYNSFLQTDQLLDSIQSIVNSIDYDDVKNVEIINQLLAKGELGDTLHVKLTHTFQQAKEFVKGQSRRREVDSLSRVVLLPASPQNKWQEELFGLTSPLGTSLILSGIQQELLEAGIIAFTKK